MTRIENDATMTGPLPKPRWRKPELLQDRLVDATNIDSTPSGDDGVPSYGGTNLGQTS